MIKGEIKPEGIPTDLVERIDAEVHKRGMRLVCEDLTNNVDTCLVPRLHTRGARLASACYYGKGLCNHGFVRERVRSDLSVDTAVSTYWNRDGELASYLFRQIYAE